MALKINRSSGAGETPAIQWRGAFPAIESSDKIGLQGCFNTKIYEPFTEWRRAILKSV